MNVCVVTGGGSGIGKAVVEAFGKDVWSLLFQEEVKQSLKKCRMS